MKCISCSSKKQVPRFYRTTEMGNLHEICKMFLNGQLPVCKHGYNGMVN